MLFGKNTISQEERKRKKEERLIFRFITFG
jgi:hypothetical protein